VVENRWAVFKVFLAFCLLTLSVISLQMIDYGASFKCYQECKEAYEAQGLSKDFNFVMQGLFFSKVEPRIAYHLGLMVVLTCILLFSLVYIREVIVK